MASSVCMLDLTSEAEGKPNQVKRLSWLNFEKYPRHEEEHRRREEEMLRQREQEELRRQQEGGFKPNFMDNVSAVLWWKSKLQNNFFITLFLY